MKKAIIGKKVGMTQIFDESGKVIPVTVVEAGPCVVTQKKTVETDGYTAVQLGFGDIKEHKLSKPEAGHLKKAGVAPKKYLKEFKLESAADMNVGDEVKADTFAAGDKIDVTGITKGHGDPGVGPGMAPRITIMFSSASTFTTSRFSMVTWSQPIWPAPILPGKIRDW